LSLMVGPQLVLPDCKQVSVPASVMLLNVQMSAEILSGKCRAWNLLMLPPVALLTEIKPD
jgi:hypothetical protein